MLQAGRRATGPAPNRAGRSGVERDAVAGMLNAAYGEVVECAALTGGGFMLGRYIQIDVSHADIPMTPQVVVGPT